LLCARQIFSKPTFASVVADEYHAHTIAALANFDAILKSILDSFINNNNNKKNNNSLSLRPTAIPHEGVLRRELVSRVPDPGE